MSAMKSIQQRNLFLTLVSLLLISSPAAGHLIRLAGSGSTHCSGRVEISYRGTWSTVCDDEWDLYDAQVVCRELNCGKALSAPTEAYFGEGTNEILLDNVDCSGMEDFLYNCEHRGFGNHDCQHSEDAGVICSESLTKPNISISPVGEVTFGQDVNISCSISTKVSEGIFILRKIPGSFKEIQILSTNSATFKISNVDFIQEGFYKCQYKKRISGQDFKSPLSDPVSLFVTVRLQQPIISLTSSNRGLVWSPEGAEVTRGYSFELTCSINCSYPEGRFFLISSASNFPDTKPAVNHSASFNFPVAEYEHQGNYSCVYEVTLSTLRFNSTKTAAIMVVIKLPLLQLVSLVAAGILLWLVVVLVVVVVGLICRRRQQAKQPGALVHTQLATRVRSCHKDEAEDEEVYMNVDPVDTKNNCEAAPGRVEEENIYEVPERCNNSDYVELNQDSNFRKAEVCSDESRQKEDETSDVEDNYDNVLQLCTEPSVDIHGNHDHVYQSI